MVMSTYKNKTYQLKIIYMYAYKMNKNIHKFITQIVIITLKNPFFVSFQQFISTEVIIRLHLNNKIT